MPTKTRKQQTAAEIDTLLDEIKDEIDRLHEIKDRKLRKSAAVDLIEYIQLHQVEYLE